MRRILSIAILFAIVFPVAAPAFGQDVAARIAYCCRKGAVHHCTQPSMDGMDAMPADIDQTMVMPTCPFTHGVSQVAHAGAAPAVLTPQAGIAHAVTPLAVRQVEAGYRIASYRSRHKRGPPAPALS